MEDHDIVNSTLLLYGHHVYINKSYFDSTANVEVPLKIELDED